MEVGILYAGGAKVWKPLTSIADFQKTDVLTFSFTTVRGVRSALVARMWSYQNNDTVARQAKAWWGDDIYYVGVLPNGDFFTTQTPENDEKIPKFSARDGTRSGIVECPRTWPADATMHRFVGGYLPPEAWDLALDTFEREMF